MATQRDLDAHYTLIDKVFRLSLGEKCSYSCARFDGDFSRTLEEAQRAKHQFVVEACNIGRGTRVLDMGCGWGAFIDYADKLGAKTRGVALAKGQTDACIRNGLNVTHMDFRDITADTFGPFDAVVAMGSTEHLCSVEQYRAGERDTIYSTYFAQVASLLPIGGRFYCQTMVFGPNMVRFEDIRFNQTDLWKKKEEYTNEELVDILCQIFPGSWLTHGKEGLIAPASKYFTVVSIDSGRLDYIETIKRWSQAVKRFDLRKYLFFAGLLPEYLTSRPFRAFVQRWKSDANIPLFEREVFEHYRVVFEKVRD